MKKLTLLSIKAALMLAVCFNSFNTSAQGTILDAKKEGAKGDGAADDTKAIEQLLIKASQTGSTVMFPDGTYMLNPVLINLANKKSLTIKGSSGKAILKRIPSEKNSKIIGLLHFVGDGNSNVNLSDISLDGGANKVRSLWTKKGNKIYIQNPSNGVEAHWVNSLVVNNCTISNFHGSGISLYSSKNLECNNNKLEELEECGIRADEIHSSVLCRGNKIRNVGLCPMNYVLDGVETTRKSTPAVTMFGDGITAYANKLIAQNNIIENAGRCGIVHDLAIDYHIKNSYAQVNDNTVIIDNDLISNDNPPAGMWFEQSGQAIVYNNKIILKNSTTPIFSAIRFYLITDKLRCNDNTIDASAYNKVCNTGISVQNLLATDVEITGNKINGQFNVGISMNYDRKDAKTDIVKIDRNKIVGDPRTTQNGITLAITDAFSKKTSISENEVESVKDMPFKLTTKATTQNSAIDFNGNRFNGQHKVFQFNLPNNIKLNQQ